MSTTNSDTKSVELYNVKSVSDSDPLENNSPIYENEKVDDAVAFLVANEGLEPLSEAEQRHTIRKTDWILLPCLFFTATMGAVDKVSLGTAAIFGLRDDNNLVGQQYSWLGSILFVGSLVGMWPMTYLVQRFRTGKVIAMASLFWSTITLLQCACSNFASLALLRFLMGMAECVIVPGCSLLISVFYLKHESPHRTALVFAFASSVINGALSSLASTFAHNIPTWKYIFLLVGAISFVWSCTMIFFLPDSPINAKFLSQREKLFMVKRVAANSTGVSSNSWKWNQVFEGCLDVRSYIVMLFNFGINVPNGGLSTFSSIIMTNLGYSSVKSSLMGIPTGVIASLAAFAFTWLGARWVNRRCLLAFISLIVPLVGSVICYSCPHSNIAAQLVGLYMMYFYFASYVVMISCVQANTAGNTKKAVTYGLNYLGYCGGAITGTQTFRSNQAPRYTGGFISMLVGYAACMGLCISYWVVCVFLNRLKRQALANNELESNEFDDDELKVGVENEKVLDLTDKEQKYFFYTT